MIDAQELLRQLEYKIEHPGSWGGAFNERAFLIELQSWIKASLTASPTGGQLGPGNPSNPSETALRNHLLGEGKEDE